MSVFFRKPEYFSNGLLSSNPFLKSLSQDKKLLLLLWGKLQKKWRTGWDSNPRYGYPYAGFQDRSHKPLDHLSVKAKAIMDDTLVKSKESQMS